jgi:hypothetical protein
VVQEACLTCLQAASQPVSQSAVPVAARADQPAGEPQYNPHPKKLETSIVCLKLKGLHGRDFNDSVIK